MVALCPLGARASTPERPGPAAPVSPSPELEVEPAAPSAGFEAEIEAEATEELEPSEPTQQAARDAPASELEPPGASFCAGECLTARAALDLPVCAEPAEAVFDPEIAPTPSKQQEAGYVPPSSTSREALQAALTALLEGDAEAALRAAELGGYAVCRDPADHDVALFRPEAPEAGYARFAWRVRGAQPVIVEAPHPHYDLETDTQASLLFERLRARALLMAGAHRCSADEHVADCSGTTGVCGQDGAPYPASDVAHSDDTLFHAAHVFFAETFASDWVVSLHGFTESGISVSDGTPAELSGDAAAARVGAALQAIFPEAPITSCNPYPGAVVKGRRCGTTNVQGRHVNGAPDACAAPATESAGRFVHLEQSLEVRRRYPERVAEAIEAALQPPAGGSAASLVSAQE